MPKRVNIENLSEYTVTRNRGKEAAGKLLGLVAQEPIDLLTDSAEVLSTSFLDQIVLELAAGQSAEQVTFVTSNPDTIAKLGRIAAIREAVLYARGPDDAERRLVKPGRPVTETVFSDHKVPALNQ